MSEANGNGRDAAGRFAADNAGGPGRPRREVERQYLDATLAAVSVEDWTEIVKRAAVDAKAGDGKARDWLSRVLGIDAARAAPDDAGDGITRIVVIEDPNWYGNDAHRLERERRVAETAAGPSPTPLSGGRQDAGHRPPAGPAHQG
ncbi:MAG TPA: hypothetical protein VMV10_08180 [Pirellulales bacterium]|nr:hypothetical protein [Pirellulales bacterium]